MPLKIFISSVFHELQNERKALEEEIHKLQDLFVGMEFFGSTPDKPADYCREKAKEADLYVGLFGQVYGSIDQVSDLSFTQLEYDAAYESRIPSLIYFKVDDSSKPIADPRLKQLKEKLRLRHIVYTFSDIFDLKLRFLADFIGLLRRDLFDKTIPVNRGPIPADGLLSLTQGFINEQIKSVGQDKYIRDIYVNREAENEISGFTRFEKQFQARAATILDHLDASLKQCSLGDEASAVVSRARIALTGQSAEDPKLVLEELRQTFRFFDVEAAIDVINSLIMEPSDSRFELGVRQMILRLRTQPFVNKSLMSETAGHLSNERQRAMARRALQTDYGYQDLLQLFPSHAEKGKTYLVNDLLKELTRLIELGTKRCLVLVDRAGTGKTNIACHLAEQLIREHPVVLLSGQIELSTEYDIEFHIQQRFESAFSGIFTDWMARISPSLQEAGRWLFIIIDGINENSKRPLFIQLLKALLPRLEQRRIKLILTCRDLMWDVFRDALAPYIFEGALALNDFNEAEWRQAIERYFRVFEVECTLDKEAQLALRNPLLLRFFCEAHRKRKLGRIRNLRLLSIFDLYVERVGRSISERYASLKPNSVPNLLVNIARHMWEQRCVTINASSVGISSQEMGETNSVYNLILSENIILEQTTQAYSSLRTVRFLYDEFMEYMIARSWVDQIAGSKNKSVCIQGLLHDAFESLGSFPSGLGAVLFLDKMMDHHGEIVSDFIKQGSHLDTLFFNSQQTSLVYALENINFQQADSELIDVVAKFEPAVRDDLKDRMAAIVLGILEAHPNHKYARRFVQHVLEVESTATAGDSNRSAREMLEARKSAATKHDKAPRLPNENEMPRLPPARYHYSEETKVSAIGILVQKQDDRDYAVIEEGIRRLGRTDLHSALQALAYVDVANDELIYKTVAEYLEAKQPEYRIYCAWLLRERYGKTAAGFIVRLLKDIETRVHQYTAGLFENRLIERELIEEVLQQLRTTGLTTWQMKHFVRLLGKSEQFFSDNLAVEYGAAIVELLDAFLGHQQASIRLEIYRSLSQYPSFILPTLLRKRMLIDGDRYVRVLAEKLWPDS